jgi:hypothetical protein
MLMSCQFGITPAFNGYGQWLAPTDAPVFSRKGKFSVDPALRAFGKKEVVETFKLFISNQEFNPLLMAQDDLEKPDPSLRNIPDKDLNGMDRLLNAVQDRSAIFDEEDDSSASSYDWATMNMSVIVKYVGK